MIDFPVIFNSILVVLWIVFTYYLVTNKKVIPINTLGFMVSASVLYIYIITYDLQARISLNEETKYEVLVCRALVLLVFQSVVTRAKTINTKLTKMSENEKNLLKPKI